MSQRAGGKRYKLPTEDHRAQKAKFKIAGRFETDVLAMQEWLPRETVVTSVQSLHSVLPVMPGQLSHKQLDPHGPQESRYQRNLEGLDARQTNHRDGRAVRTHQNGPALRRSFPQRLIAKRELPIVKREAGIGFKELHTIHSGERSIRIDGIV